ncbi:hypothetical protein [Daejeonella sp.]|uniref:hypothetical protein n=1 Tax=Daejeonella sp. TaxID=2805397 RepID=UPI0025C2DD33|nr:hypothetical protein [Daejeonella sp.]
MKSIIIALALTALISTSSSGQMYLQDVDGKPFIEKNAIDVIGSPFLNNEFINGKVTLNNGNKYENIPLKYSIFKDELYFKNPKDGSLLSFVVPVKNFELLGLKYINGLPAIDNFTDKTFYGLIADGKMKLLVKNYKTILENKQYNSATIEKKYEDIKSYFILKDGNMQRFKPSKKEFLMIFEDKNLEIDSYLKKEKIDFKNNLDLAKVFEYYFSL